MIAAALLSMLLAAAAPDPPGAGHRVPPIDQCAADPSFAAFRSELLQAVARRDAGYLLAVAADDILVDFGGSSGRTAFAENWGLAEPETSLVWDELATVLALGCAREEDGTSWAPSLYRQLGARLDPTTTLVAIRPGAALHAARDRLSPVVAELEWDVLVNEDGLDPGDWYAVSMEDGRRGYVASADVRSPLDLRAGFARRDGSWRLIAFVAGD